MKSGYFATVKFVLVFALMTTILIPFRTSAQDYYITAKPGIYSPQTDDLEDFDTGFNGEIAFGWQPNTNFAAEIGLGYFNTEAKERFSGQVGGVSFAGELKAELNIFPITFTLKGIVPYKKWEFFGLGGIGAYIVSGDLKARFTVDGVSVAADLDDWDTVFGGYLGLGIHYNMTRTIFVGAEGKYLWTNKAKLQDVSFGVPIETEFRMDGILAMAVIGFRF